MAQEIIALKLEKQIFAPEEWISYDLIIKKENNNKGIKNFEFKNLMSQDKQRVLVHNNSTRRFGSRYELYSRMNYSN